MKPAPLSEQIRSDIETKIMSGAWAPGHRIPPEHELMEAYACSRMTVSKALSILADRGLVDRRKRAGSFVSTPTMHRATLEIPDIAAEVEALGHIHRLDILSRIEREATADDRDLLATYGGRVLQLDALHRADGAPFAIEQRTINLALAPAARDIDFSRESPGRWLLGHVPWTDAKHRITAVAASKPVAAALFLDEHAPCLQVERWTWRTAERITYVRQIYPGTHALTARFIA